MLHIPASAGASSQHSPYIRRATIWPAADTLGYNVHPKPRPRPSPMQTQKSSVSRYVLALLATVAALASGELFWLLFGGVTRYHTLWFAAAAVVFSAWCCGFGPSITAALSAVAAIWFLLLTPRQY